MCQQCYAYFKGGGKVYALPPAGEIKRDENGKVICHICGRSFHKLGSHTYQFHDMTIKQYKEKFSLCHRARTTEISYADKMRGHCFANNMDNRILEWGMGTRIKDGEKLREGKKGTIQESLMKRNRMKARYAK